MIAGLINGEAVDQLAVADRGLHYGDGIFRTLRVSGGRPLAWRWHMQALARDADRLALPMPDESTWWADVDVLFDDGGDGVLKLLLTRGSGGRGYRPPDVCESTRMSLRYALPPERPLRLKVDWAQTRLGLGTLLAGIKHLNRLEQVMIGREMAERDCDELLVCNESGYVVCGGMSSLFVFDDDRLLLPDLAQCGIRGATRDRMIQWARRQGIDVAVCELSPESVTQSDALALGNSVMGLHAVQRLGARSWPEYPLIADAAGWLAKDDPEC